MSSIASGLAAINTLLKYGDGGCPETFVTLANVGNIGGPAMQLAEEKTTSHSTDVPWDTFIPTVIEAGEIPFDLFFIPSSNNHKTALGFFKARAFKDWTMTFPDGVPTVWAFNGYFKKFSITANTPNAIKASAAIRVSGQIYFP